MGTSYSSKKFAEYHFDESDELVEKKSIWNPAKSVKKKPRSDDSSVDKYTFLQSFAGGKESKGKKLRDETVTIHDDDDDNEAVKERIVRSDTALQSSSSNYSSKSFAGSKHSDVYTPKPLKAVPQQFCLADNEPVSLISDDEDDNSSAMSSNDLANSEGSSGEQILVEEITSHEMEPSVVLHPKYTAYGGNCYWNAQLTFFRSSIKLDVSEEEETTGPLTSEWKTVDLISIESKWVDPFPTADVCFHIKSEHPKLAFRDQKSGIVKLNFTVSDPEWISTQELIKSLDEQYKEKWDVDLDSDESFEDITYRGDSDSISISKRDFQLLHPEKFLNDTIVDFYIEYMKKIKPADERVHFFNSFFFRKLADFDENQLQMFDAKSAFQRVRKWTKKVDIFQKDYIFIPVNFRLHWSLIVICHPGEVVNYEEEELEILTKVPCILHMDSIKGSHRGVENCIKCYLWEEWKERNSNTVEDISTKFKKMLFLRLEVPQQQNSSDCGLFMLHYMELFMKQAPLNFNPLSSFISKDWFYPTEASLKRGRIKRLILELAKSKSEHVLSPNCNDEWSSEAKDADEEESEVQILDETCNSKESFHDSSSDACLNTSRVATPIIVKSPRSEQEKSHCEEFSETEDNGGSLVAGNEQNHGQLVAGNEQNHGQLVAVSEQIRGQLVAVDDQNYGQLVAVNEQNHGQLVAVNEQNHGQLVAVNEQNHGQLVAGNEQNHGQLVLYDPSIAILSEMKEGDAKEVVDKQVTVSGKNAKATRTEFMTSLGKSLNLLRIKESYPCGRLLGHSSTSEPLVEDKYEQSQSPSSSDEVFETCVVEDSDSDDSGHPPRYRQKLASSEGKASSCFIRKDNAGNRLSLQTLKRRHHVDSEAQKRLRRSSSEVISLCE